MAFQLIEEVTAHAQSDSLEDAREICADDTYFPYNLRTNVSYLGEVPSFGGLGNGIRHLSTGGPKKHHFVRPDVHHVEERLDPHRRVAL